MANLNLQISQLQNKTKFAIAFGFGAITSLGYVSSAFSWLPWLSMIPFFLIVFAENKFSPKQMALLFFTFAMGLYTPSMVWFYALGDMLDIPKILIYFIMTAGLAILATYQSGYLAIVGYFYGKLNLKPWAKISYMAICWYLVEIAQSVVLNGFPWLNLAVSQGTYPILIQSVTIFGINILAAFMVFINGLLAMALLNKKANFAMVAAALFALNLGYGAYVLNAEETYTEYLDVAVIHGEVEASLRWDMEHDDEIWAAYESQILSATGSDLILIPETAMPYSINVSDYYASKYLTLAKTTGANILVGAFYRDMENSENSENSDDIIKYNSYYVATPNGDLDVLYHKQKLVPFGEYTPLEDIFRKIIPESFLDSFPESALTKGNISSVISVEDIKIGALICFDSIFSQLLVGQNDNPEILVVGANEGWYSETSVVYYHLNHSIIRAVEQNKYLLRSVNGGYSAIIDNHGEIIAINDDFKYTNDESYEQENSALMATVPLIEGSSPYAKFGAYYIGIMALILGLIIRLGGNKK